MTELCCSHSISERLSRAQLLLYPEFRVSQVLHSTTGARNLAGHSVVTLLTLDTESYPYQAGFLDSFSRPFSWPRRRQFKNLPSNLATPVSSALPGKRAFC